MHRHLQFSCCSLFPFLSKSFKRLTAAGAKRSALERFDATFSAQLICCTSSSSIFLLFALPISVKVVQKTHHNRGKKKRFGTFWRYFLHSANLVCIAFPNVLAGRSFQKVEFSPKYCTGTSKNRCGSFQAQSVSLIDRVWEFWIFTISTVIWFNRLGPATAENAFWVLYAFEQTEVFEAFFDISTSIFKN